MTEYLFTVLRFVDEFESLKQIDESNKEYWDSCSLTTFLAFSRMPDVEKYINIAISNKTISKDDAKPIKRTFTNGIPDRTDFMLSRKGSFVLIKALYEDYSFIPALKVMKEYTEKEDYYNECNRRYRKEKV